MTTPDPADLADADLVRAYQQDEGEAGDPVQDALADEIAKRGLDT